MGRCVDLQKYGIFSLSLFLSVSFSSSLSFCFETSSKPADRWQTKIANTLFSWVKCFRSAMKSGASLSYRRHFVAQSPVEAPKKRREFLLWLSACLCGCVDVCFDASTTTTTQEKKKLEIAGLRLTSVFWGGKVEWFFFLFFYFKSK